MEPQPKSSSSVSPEAMQTLQFWARFLGENPGIVSDQEPQPPMSEQESKAIEAAFKTLFSSAVESTNQDVTSSAPSSTPQATADAPFESVRQIYKVQPMLTNMFRQMSEVFKQQSASSPDEPFALKQLVQRFTTGFIDDAFKIATQETVAQNQNPARMADLSRVMKEGYSACIDALFDKPLDERFWNVCTPESTLGSILEAGTERFIAPLNTLFHRFSQVFGNELYHAPAPHARELFQEAFSRFKAPQWTQANIQAGARPLLPAAAGSSATAFPSIPTDVLLKKAGLGELVPFTQNTQLASNYEFRLANPKNDYERAMTQVFTTLMPVEAIADQDVRQMIEVSYSQFFGFIYQMANANTPEEFDQKMARIQKAKEVVQSQQDPQQSLAKEQMILKALLSTESGNIGMAEVVDKCFERFKKDPKEKDKYDELYAKAMIFYMQELAIEAKKGMAEGMQALKLASADELMKFSPQEIMSRSFARIQEKTKARIEAWAKREQSEDNKQYLLLIRRQLEILVDSSTRIAFHEQEELKQALQETQSLTHQGRENRILLTQTDKIVMKLFDSKSSFAETLSLMRDIDSLDDTALVLRLQTHEDLKHQNDLHTLQSAARVEEVD